MTARPDRLTQEVRQVVQTAAVLGREFEVQILTYMPGGAVPPARRGVHSGSGAAGDPVVTV
ncbi:MAG: hypothetical protein IPL78_06355 [Chloroflexi bacterium]|nr:hypothetical protein [Chloroflexota bacterium]